MTHELKHIVQVYEHAKSEGLGAVLATVVALDGSSYRRPGVRMLVLENGSMIGAVSGGCVEKEVLRQAASVFSTTISKVMVYDGRYRLGCEGTLYILLEAFDPSADWLTAFKDTLKGRRSFEVKSYYQKAHGIDKEYGSVFFFNGNPFPLQKTTRNSERFSCYQQMLPPCFRLLLLGAEHDAVVLCGFASKAGWEVTVVADPKEEKKQTDFPGTTTFLQAEAALYQPETDGQTAVVLMTHSFAKDLQFLIALQKKSYTYLGLLGPAKRREALFDALLERLPELDESFLTSIHGPAGLHIGAETPQEIAIAIMAEIVSHRNDKIVMPLREKEGSIHQ